MLWVGLLIAYYKEHSKQRFSCLIYLLCNLVSTIHCGVGGRGGGAGTYHNDPGSSSSLTFSTLPMAASHLPTNIPGKYAIIFRHLKSSPAPTPAKKEKHQKQNKTLKFTGHHFKSLHKFQSIAVEQTSGYCAVWSSSSSALFSLTVRKCIPYSPVTQPIEKNLFIEIVPQNETRYKK